MTQQGHANGLSDNTGFGGTTDSRPMDAEIRAGDEAGASESVGRDIESGVLANGDGTDDSEQHDHDQQPDSSGNGERGHKEDSSGQGSSGRDEELRDFNSDDGQRTLEEGHEFSGVQHSPQHKSDSGPRAPDSKTSKNGRNVKDESVHNEPDSNVYAQV